MNQFRFAQPEWLLLLPVLLFCGFLLRKWLGQRSSLLFSNIAPFQGAPQGWRVRLSSTLPPLLRWLAVTLGILVLARPQTVERKQWFESTGVDVLLSIDTSGSMGIIDMDSRGNNVIEMFQNKTIGVKDIWDRLDVVKAVVKKFIKGRKGDRISLIVFGKNARTLTPLTHDLHAVNSFLKLVELGMVGHQTDLQKAITFGLKRLIGLTVEDILEMAKTRSREYILEQIRTKRCSFVFDKETQKRIAASKVHKELLNAMRAKKARSQILILLTDGKHTAKQGAEGREDVLQAAREAALFKVKIYTIGIGRQNAQTFIRFKHNGRSRLRPIENPSFDQDLLQEVARLTQGRFFSANTKDALQNVYKEIDKLEPNRFKLHKWDDIKELYLWLLIPMFFILGLELLLRETLFRRIP